MNYERDSLIEQLKVRIKKIVQINQVYYEDDAVKIANKEWSAKDVTGILC